MAENNNFSNKFYLNRFDKDYVNMQAPRKHKSNQQIDDKMKISGQSNKTTSSQKSSWGRDSGARDLDFPASPEHTFELEDPGIHITLNNEIIELRERLKRSDHDKDELKMQIQNLYEDKANTQRHLETITSSYDSRITEMHSIIIELNKKLKMQQEKAIIEENEGSVSELSFQEGSVYNSDIETVHEESESRETENKEEPSSEQEEPQKPQRCHKQRIQTQTSPQMHKPNFPSQIESLQEEILHLKAQIALLQTELACRDQDQQNEEEDEQDPTSFEEIEEEEQQEETAEIHTPSKNEDNENDKSIHTSEEFCEPVESQQINEFSKITTAQCIKTNNVICSPTKHSLPTKRPLVVGNNYRTTNIFEQPITKVAERVKLKRTMEDNFITGTDLTSSAIHTTELAEHLVSEFIQPESNMVTNEEIQSEIQRLHRRIEHLKLQNSVLTLTLTESKQHCNHLYLLCGKYESNAIALSQALEICDREIEAYDVMLALLESKFGVLENSESAEENRKAAESVAHLLLDRLNCESSLHGKSLWQDAVAILSDTDDEKKPWTDDNDKLLRNHVSKLKGKRSLVQNTVVNLESPFHTEESKNEALNTSPPSSRNSRSRQKCMDLETAVLMQELMNMREDMSELKYQVEQSEKEKNLAYEKLKALNLVLVESEALLALQNTTKDRFSYSEAEHNLQIERELLEALGRESRLKARLQGLALSLESAARMSEERHTLVQNTVSELKQTNLSLSQSLEKCKRKYQSKIKRLEQQILGMKLNNPQYQQTNNKNENQLIQENIDHSANSSNNAVTDTD